MKNGNIVLDVELEAKGLSVKRPGIIYKYLDNIGGRLALHERTIKYTAIQYLNDAFECMPKGISWTDAERIIDEAECAKKDLASWKSFCGSCAYLKDLPAEMQAYFKENPRKCFAEAFDNLADTVRKMVATHFETKRETLAVASFSGKKNSLTMWAHYADRHQGVVIGYDPSCFQRLFPKTNSLFAVNYSENRIEIPLELDALWGRLDLLAKTKSVEWAHEDEWRSVVLASNIETVKYGYFFEQVMPEEILEINIGVCADLFLKKVCDDFCKNHPTCRLFQTTTIP